MSLLEGINVADLYARRGFIVFALLFIKLCIKMSFLLLFKNNVKQTQTHTHKPKNFQKKFIFLMKQISGDLSLCGYTNKIHLLLLFYALFFNFFFVYFMLFLYHC